MKKLVLTAMMAFGVGMTGNVTAADMSSHCQLLEEYCLKGNQTACINYWRVC